MKLKRILSLFLAALTALSVFTACGEEEPVREKRTNVYKGESLSLPEGLNYVNQMACANGNAYITYYKEYTITYNEKGEEVERRLGYYWQAYEDVVVEEEVVMPYYAMSSKSITLPSVGGSSEEDYQGDVLPEGWYYGYENIQHIATIPLDGSPITEVPVAVSQEEYGYVSNIYFGANGSFIANTSLWTYDEEVQMSVGKYYIILLDPATGAVQSSHLLNDVFEAAKLDPQMTYVNSIEPAPDGTYYVSTETQVLHLDGDFNLINMTEIENGWINRIALVGSRPLVCYYTDTSGLACKFIDDGTLTDVEASGLKNIFENYYNVIGSGENKIYYQQSDGVWEYDITTDTQKEILNYINSDIDSTNNVRMIALEDGRILMSSTDYYSTEYATTMEILSPVPNEELQEEIIVRLGTLYSDYNVTRAVIRYNKQNTGIRIAVVNYDRYNSAENDWQGAVQQMNNDIVTGNLPDLISLNSNLPVASYFNKGVFADLNQFIDDEEIGLNRDEYEKSVLDANSVDGKLYSMILTFNMRTIFAKEKWVGNEPGWTFDEMMQVVSAMPEGMKAFFDQGRDGIVSTLLYTSLSSFVDWETGTTQFESQGFIDFIKYLSTCSQYGFYEEYYQSMGDQYVYDEEKEREMGEIYAMRFYNDYALFNSVHIGSFTDLIYQYNQFASKDITPIGYPTTTEGANGTVIVPSLELAISASSRAKKEAWEIVKFLMEDENINQGTYQFYISKKANEANAAAAADNYYYYETPESEYEWYLSSGYSQEYVDFLKNSQHPFDQAAVDMTMELLRGAGDIQRQDTELTNIIMEELSVYFAGTRSAEETARIIASRARIYISENS